MRLASADRHSGAKWLWGLLGVLAWVILATAFSTASASAADDSDAKAQASTASSSTKHDGQPPRSEPTAKAAPAERAQAPAAKEHRPQAQTAQGHAPKEQTSPGRADHPRAAVTDKVRPQNAGKGGTPSGQQSSIPAAKPAPGASVSPVAKPANPNASTNANANANAKAKADTSADEISRDDSAAPSTDDDTRSHSKSDRPRLPAASDPASRHDDAHRADGSLSSHGRGNAHGHLKHSLADGSDHAPHHGHDQRDARLKAKHGMRLAAAHARLDHARTVDVDRQNLVASAVLQSPPDATAEAAPRDSAPIPHSPIPDEMPGSPPSSAPSTSGAGSAGFALLQVSGDAIAGSTELTSILLSIARHSDDHLPSGPSAATDCSPD